MVATTTFLKIECCAASGWSVMIEDDGRVCYAYLLSAVEQLWVVVGDIPPAYLVTVMRLIRLVR